MLQSPCMNIPSHILRQDLLESEILINDETLRNKVLEMMRTNKNWNALCETCKTDAVSDKIMLMWVDKCIWGKFPDMNEDDSDRKILTDCIKWYSENLRKIWASNLKAN